MLRLKTARMALTVLLASTALMSCNRSRTSGVDVDLTVDRTVFLEVEVFDPNTNLVWENVGVRLVDSFQDWNNSTTVSPFVDDFEFTDRDGVVLFTPEIIASYQVGFREDDFDRAILGSRSYEDTASVTLEVFAPGFAPVIATVRLTFDEPDVFISVPFN